MHDDGRTGLRPGVDLEDKDALAELLDMPDEDDGQVVLSGPAATAVCPGKNHLATFTRLCREVGARANAVSDAYHAAPAIEHGATWVTSGRGFARLPGLRWMPLPAG